MVASVSAAVSHSASCEVIVQPADLRIGVRRQTNPAELRVPHQLAQGVGRVRQ